MKNVKIRTKAGAVWRGLPAVLGSPGTPARARTRGTSLCSHREATKQY